MFTRIVTSAVFAGVLVGCLAALIQFLFVTPLLLEGELYESGAKIHFASDGSTQSAAGAAFSLFEEPARHLMTIGFNMVAFTGFALLLVAAFALYERSGGALSARQGLLWGLAGFVAVQLAPALGMPPELPGTIRAEVELRQIWWFGTILATGAGLALIAFGGTLLAGLFGAGLMLIPHLVGAPQLDTYFGVAPPELSAQFATRSLGVSAVSWSLLGLIAATFWTRFKEA